MELISDERRMSVTLRYIYRHHAWEAVLGSGVSLLQTARWGNSALEAVESLQEQLKAMDVEKV